MSPRDLVSPLIWIYFSSPLSRKSCIFFQFPYFWSLILVDSRLELSSCSCSCSFVIRHPSRSISSHSCCFYLLPIQIFDSCLRRYRFYLFYFFFFVVLFFSIPFLVILDSTVNLRNHCQVSKEMFFKSFASTFLKLKQIKIM